MAWHWVVYQDYGLTVAKHPSRRERRLMIMDLIRIVCQLSIAGLAIVSFWYPKFASWTFILVFILLLDGFSCWVLFGFRKFKTAANHAPYYFSEDEAELVTKFAPHFLYTGTTIAISSVLATNGIAAVIFVPVLIYKTMYIEATLIALNWLLAGPLSHKFSPLKGLKMLSSKGNEEAARLLAAWDSTWDKMIAAGKNAR